MPITNDRMDGTGIDIVPLAPLIGAEVSGVDVRALDERHLLVVPSLSPAGAAPFDACGVLVAFGALGAFLLATAKSLRAASVP